ncbi:MAG: thiol-disulfide isomerase, partial [Terriglobia bacterium]
MRLIAISLAFASAAYAQSTVTFNKDILPILQAKCQGCHRPGEIGPMSFLTYESTRPWAKSMKTAVLSRKMPPWFADPQYGHFANDRRLNDADVSKIAAWVDAGAPEGSAKDKPAPVQWTEGWNIKPDVVFQLPKAYTVPKTGTIEYTYFVVPSGFTKDTWVIDGEVRPSNRSVVHHASVHVRPRGSHWMEAAKPGEPYIPPKTPPGAAAKDANGQPLNESNEWLLGYVPGVHGEYFDKNHRAAKLIPAGSDLVFEMHYTANGKAAESDQTKVGFVLAKEPPEQRLLTVPVANLDLEIPPGNPNYPGHADATFDKPVQLVYSQPHMHLRGKDMDIRLVYPNGESQMVVSVPHFDFGWQMVYYQDKPLPLPKGTRIELSAHWDNSANNKYNPDPAATVRWGDQTWDEMIFASVGVVVDRDDNLDKVMA